MRCPLCGRDAQRGVHERNIRSMTGWLLAVAFALGCLAGAACACAAAIAGSVL